MLDKDAFFCMWTTSTMIEHAFSLLKNWGLKYLTILFVYNKKSKHSERLHLGFGHYTQG